MKMSWYWFPLILFNFLPLNLGAQLECPIVEKILGNESIRMEERIPVASSLPEGLETVEMRTPGWKAKSLEVDGVEKISFEYGIEGDTLEIGFVHIAPDLRGNGLQNQLFSQVLKENPQITRIHTSQLVETNQQVFYTELLHGLKKHGLSMPELAIPKKEELLRSRAGQLFRSCCYERLLLLPTDIQNQIIQDSLLMTPAYKTRKKLGFGNICSPMDSTLTTLGQKGLKISFDSCKI